MKRFVLFLISVPFCLIGVAQKSKSFQLTSPDKKFVLTIQTGEKITWAVMHGQQTVIIPSTISIQLSNGEVLGKNVTISSSNYEATVFKDGINADRDATDYKKEIIKINAATKLNVHLASGGGFAMRIIKL